MPFRRRSLAVLFSCVLAASFATGAGTGVSAAHAGTTEGVWDYCHVATDGPECARRLYLAAAMGFKVVIEGADNLTDYSPGLVQFLAQAKKSGVKVMWAISSKYFWGWNGSGQPWGWQPNGNITLKALPGWAAACKCTTNAQLLSFMVHTLSANGTLYGFYAADDSDLWWTWQPGWPYTSQQFLSGVTQFVANLHQLAPGSVELIGSAGGDEYNALYGIGDLTGEEFYEIHNQVPGPDTGYAEYTDIQNRISSYVLPRTGSGPTSFILQAFSFGEWGADPTWRYPTADEMRVMLQAISGMEQSGMSVPSLISWYNLSDTVGYPAHKETWWDNFPDPSDPQTRLASLATAVQVYGNGSGSGTVTPTWTLPVTVTGAARVGQTLAMSGNGKWFGNPAPVLSYQWQRSTGTGSWQNIPGATGTEHAATDSDMGRGLRLIVTAKNGSGTAAEASAATPIISGIAPQSTSPPTVSGNVTVTGTLSATAGIWTADPAATFAYQWQRQTGATWSNVQGATSAKYKTGDGDIGHAMRVIVTATNAYGHASVQSAATQPIVGIAPKNTSGPTLTGSTGVGRTLTAHAGKWTGDPSPTFAYLWQHAGADGKWTAIAGANAGSYSPQKTDLGDTLRVIVTAKNAYGTSAGQSTASTKVHVPAPPKNTAPPELTGAAADGEVLSLSPGTWDSTQGSVTLAYQWQRFVSSVWTNIPGATTGSYTPQQADVGHQLRVTVTAVNTDGSTQAASAASGVIQAASGGGTGSGGSGGGTGSGGSGGGTGSGSGGGTGTGGSGSGTGGSGGGQGGHGQGRDPHLRLLRDWDRRQLLVIVVGVTRGARGHLKLGFSGQHPTSVRRSHEFVRPGQARFVIRFAGSVRSDLVTTIRFTGSSGWQSRSLSFSPATRPARARPVSARAWIRQLAAWLSFGL